MFLSVVVIDALKAYYAGDINSYLDALPYESQSGPAVISSDDVVLGKLSYYLKWAQNKNDEKSLMPNSCYVPLVPVFDSGDSIQFISIWNEEQFLNDFDEEERSNRHHLIVPIKKKSIDNFSLLFDNDPGMRADHATKGRDFWNDDMKQYFENTWILEEGKPRRKQFYFNYDWDVILPCMHKFMNTSEFETFKDLDVDKAKKVWEETLPWQKWEPVDLEENWSLQDLEFTEQVCVMGAIFQLKRVESVLE